MISDVPLFFGGWAGLLLHVSGTDLPVTTLGAIIIYGAVAMALDMYAIAKRNRSDD